MREQLDCRHHAWPQVDGVDAPNTLLAAGGGASLVPVAEAPPPAAPCRVQLAWATIVIQARRMALQRARMASCNVKIHRLMQTAAAPTASFHAVCTHLRDDGVSDSKEALPPRPIQRGSVLILLFMHARDSGAASPSGGLRRDRPNKEPGLARPPFPFTQVHPGRASYQAGAGPTIKQQHDYGQETARASRVQGADPTVLMVDRRQGNRGGTFGFLGRWRWWDNGNGHLPIYLHLGKHMQITWECPVSTLTSPSAGPRLPQLPTRLPRWWCARTRTRYTGRTRHSPAGRRGQQIHRMPYQPTTYPLPTTIAHVLARTA
jgi:hypothetical protein